MNCNCKDDCFLVKELKKENAELKANNEAKDIQIKELQEQKCYWKESSFDWQHKFFKKDEVKQLVKKENVELKRIVKMVAMINKGIYTNEGIKAIYAEAEQFLSEVEK